MKYQLFCAGKGRDDASFRPFPTRQQCVRRDGFDLEATTFVCSVWREKLDAPEITLDYPSFVDTEDTYRDDGINY